MRKIKVVLKDVQKQEAQDLKITSIKLRPEQLEFIKSKNINLSELIRTIIDDLIEQDEREKSSMGDPEDIPF